MLSGSFGVMPLFLKHRCILLRCQAFSTVPSHTSCNKYEHNSKTELTLEEEAAARAEAYGLLENLNFETAAKILSTTPPKRKKFGIDFHLVQLFFTCLPSLAVYLVAQYARYDIRRMEAVIILSAFAVSTISFLLSHRFVTFLEVEKKKQQAEEENRAKDAELEPSKEKLNNELSDVKIRLGALEEALKEIVDKKASVPRNDLNCNQKTRNGTLKSTDMISESRIKGNGSGGPSQNANLQQKNADAAEASVQ